MNKEMLFYKNYVINETLLAVASKLSINLEEFLLLVYFINNDDEKLDVDHLSNHLFIEKGVILNAVNSLIEKGLIGLSSKKDASGKMADYVNMDGLVNYINSEINHQKKGRDIVNIYAKFEKEFGRTISSMEYEIINAWLENGFSEELILAALKEAVYNGVSNLRYIDKILFEWNKKGLKNPEDVEAYLKKRSQSNKKKEELFDYNWLDDETE